MRHNLSPYFITTNIGGKWPHIADYTTRKEQIMSDQKGENTGQASVATTGSAAWLGITVKYLITYGGLGPRVVGRRNGG